MKENRERRKKLEERRYLRIFQAKLADFPRGRILSGETPDFTVVSKGGRLGIEITTFNGSARDDEEFFSKGVAVARERYLSSGAPPCVASFLCSPWPPRHGIALQDFADRLERAVRKWLAQSASDEIDLDCSHFEFVGLQHVIPEAHLSRIDGFQKYSWTADSGYAEHPTAILRQLFGSKEDRLMHARATHEAVWLVIVAEGTSNARMLDPGQVVSHDFRSNFDRAFLIDLWAPHLYELRLTPNTIAPHCEP